MPGGYLARTMGNCVPGLRSFPHDAAGWLTASAAPVIVNAARGTGRIE